MPELRCVQAYDASLLHAHYFGQRSWQQCEVYFCDPTKMTGPTALPLKPSLALSNHSPAGFEWGYGGSGPAQLALALLLHATEDPRRARALHQRFKFAYVAHFPSDSWQLTQGSILLWINRILATEPDALKDY